MARRDSPRATRGRRRRRHPTPSGGSLPRPGNRPVLSPTAARYIGSFSSSSSARAAASALGTTRWTLASYSPIQYSRSAVASGDTNARAAPNSWSAPHAGTPGARATVHDGGQRPPKPPRRTNSHPRTASSSFPFISYPLCACAGPDGRHQVTRTKGANTKRPRWRFVQRSWQVSAVDISRTPPPPLRRRCGREPRGRVARTRADSTTNHL